MGNFRTMNSLKITILIPSCRGPDILNNTVYSIMNTSTDPAFVEFKIKVDSEEEKENYQLFFDAKNYPFDINIVWDSLTLNDYEVLFNKFVKGVEADLLWLMGDDCIVESNNWQQQFLDIVNKYPDMIFAINHRHHPWALAPVVTKKWVDVLGYLAIGEVDSWIQHVAIAAGRNIQVRHPVVIRHCEKSVRLVSKHDRRKHWKRIQKNYKQAGKKLKLAINQWRIDNEN